MEATRHIRASYIADNISSSTPVSMNLPTTKGYLTQNFLRLLLAYTRLLGYYGMDEVGFVFLVPVPGSFVV